MIFETPARKIWNTIVPTTTSRENTTASQTSVTAIQLGTGRYTFATTGAILHSDCVRRTGTMVTLFAENSATAVILTAIILGINSYLTFNALGNSGSGNGNTLATTSAVLYTDCVRRTGTTVTLFLENSATALKLTAIILGISYYIIFNALGTIGNTVATDAIVLIDCACRTETKRAE